MDIIIGAYLSYLPYVFMWSIAGFLKEGKGYFLPYIQEILEEALYLKIWPKTNVWLKYIKTYYLDRANNKVIQLNLAGLGFLRLLYTLRVILLQDLVVLYNLFLFYPLQKDPLFGCKEYQRFIVWVKSLLNNIVILDKLIMQQFWPAYKAVAKLKYKAVILKIKGV